MEVSELRRDTETFWWPRIVDDQLEVEFSEDGTMLPTPRPKQRADLMPFIECYEMAIGRAVPTGKHQIMGELKRAEGKDLGKCSFQVLAQNQDEESVEKGELANRIAAIRKPKMVVDYLTGYTRPAPDIVGVFIADKAIDNYLRLSEDPAHVSWTATSLRLAKLSDQYTAIECIKGLQNQLRRKAKEFQSLAIPPPAKKGSRLTRLEKSLGVFFRTLGENSDTTQKEPVQVGFTKGPQAADVDKARKMVAGEFEIKLKPRFKDEDAEATIEFEVSIIEDGGIGETLPLIIKDLESGSKYNFNDGRGSLIKSLKRNVAYKFEFSAGPYDRQWTISPKINVILVRNEESNE